MDINNFQDIFLENICGRCDTLEELINYLVENNLDKSNSWTDKVNSDKDNQWER